MFPKQVSPNLYKYIIQGFLEGDGNIHYNRTPDCKVSFYGTEDVCESIRDILVESCGVSKIKLRHIKNHLYEVKWGGTVQVLKILDWLYEGATTYLDRKYQQYQSIKRREFTDILETTSGIQVRNRRIKLGLSRKKLAEKIGCSVSYINGMENEYRTKVSKEIAKKLFRVLDLDEDLYRT